MLRWELGAGVPRVLVFGPARPSLRGREVRINRVNLKDVLESLCLPGLGE